MTGSPQLRPLGEAFGTEALGIDLSQPLDDATFAWIERAFAENPVLVFRKQQLGPAELSAFGRRFGRPRIHSLVKYRHAEYPEVSWLTNVEADGKVDWYGSNEPPAGTPTRPTSRNYRCSRSCMRRRCRLTRAARCSPICAPPMTRCRRR